MVTQQWLKHVYRSRAIPAYTSPFVALSWVLLMFAAVPTATSCYVLAARMGYNGAYVAGLVTVSTLLGMFSLPLALGLLANW